MQAGKIEGFGALMYQTHMGLSKNYEVSCPELDFLVGLTLDLPQVVGSRMMGGGFGGCTINLVKEDFVQNLIDMAQMQYKKEFDIELTPILVETSSGVEIINSWYYMDLKNTPHRRKNVITGDWILVSPHRTKRPWKGKKDKPQEIKIKAYDLGCYLCLGNERAGEVKNPVYKGLCF